MAETIAQDKNLTRALLQSIGVPVPEGRHVENAADAWEAATEIGLPVVVKPRYGNQGRGVATNLRTQEQVLTAYAAAREESSNIIVEKHATGGDFRLLIVGDKLIAASQRQPAQIIGDGRRTVQSLVDEVNGDPRRGEDHATCLSKIPLDAISLQVLAEQGFTLDSIPPAGQPVLVRRNANLSTGGTAADVTDFVHPEISARAIEAARMVGLDVAGVDVVCENIGRPLEQQGGVIVEVNAAPGLRMHLQPSTGRARDVGDAIVSTMFPDAQRARSDRGGHWRQRQDNNHSLDRSLGTCHRSPRRHDVHRRHLSRRSPFRNRRLQRPAKCAKLLMNPSVDAVVAETARGGILRAGLAFDRCDVAVVTNMGEGDHLGLNDIETLDKLARVKRVPVEAVGKDGTVVLNAADALVADMAKYCPGKVIFLRSIRTIP